MCIVTDGVGLSCRVEKVQCLFSCAGVSKDALAASWYNRQHPSRNMHNCAFEVVYSGKRWIFPSLIQQVNK
jgi:hypothetical protein